MLDGSDVDISKISSTVEEAPSGLDWIEDKAQQRDILSLSVLDIGACLSLSSQQHDIPTIESRR